MKTISRKSLSVGQKRLLAAAQAAMATSYSPYSRFKVGAALLTAGGRIVAGSNVENAAYGSSICAERSALVAANSVGSRSFRGIAVVATGKGIPSPCGACRQMLFEAAHNAGRDIEVILCGSGGRNAVLTSVNELLPLGFGPGLSVGRRRRSG